MPKSGIKPATGSMTVPMMRALMPIDVVVRTGPYPPGASPAIQPSTPWPKGPERPPILQGARLLLQGARRLFCSVFLDGFFGGLLGGRLFGCGFFDHFDRCRGRFCFGALGFLLGHFLRTGLHHLLDALAEHTRHVLRFAFGLNGSLNHLVALLDGFVQVLKNLHVVHIPVVSRLSLIHI